MINKAIAHLDTVKRQKVRDKIATRREEFKHKPTTIGIVEQMINSIS